jgi:hypothetical protein
MYIIGSKKPKIRAPQVLAYQSGDVAWSRNPVVNEGPPARSWRDLFRRRKPRFDPQNIGSAPGMDWVGTIASQDAAGTLLATYTTAKSVINPQALYTLIPNFLNVGSLFRVTVYGGLSNIVTTPGTVAFQIMHGSIVVWNSGNIQMNATAHTTFPFFLQVLLTCRSQGSGTSAQYMGGGILTGTHFTRTATTTDNWGANVGFTAGANVSDCCLAVPDVAPALGTGFDSTIANIFDFWVGFSISNGGNGVQIQGYCVESLN